jgi:hypothetical protein
MKAIEVLDKARTYKECSEYYPKQIEFDMAIAELEALENRNCRNCKHSWEPNNQVIFRFYCEEIHIKTHGDFCCNRWEAK